MLVVNKCLIPKLATESWMGKKHRLRSSTSKEVLLGKMLPPTLVQLPSLKAPWWQYQTCKLLF